MRRNALAIASPHIERSRLVADGNRAADERCEAFGIEIDVGESGEEGFADKRVDFRIGGARLPGAMGVHGDAFYRKYKQILQRCRRRVFAAGANLHAALPAKGLLTLIAEHVVDPVSLKLNFPEDTDRVRHQK